MACCLDASAAAAAGVWAICSIGIALGTSWKPFLAMAAIVEGDCGAIVTAGYACTCANGLDMDRDASTSLILIVTASLVALGSLWFRSSSRRKLSSVIYPSRSFHGQGQQIHGTLEYLLAQ